MMLKLSPDGKTRLLFNSFYSDDQMYEVRTGQDALDKEEVFRLSAGTDRDGNSFTGRTLDTPTPNKLDMTKAGVLGAKNFDRTATGSNKLNWRTRQHIRIVENEIER